MGRRYQCCFKASRDLVKPKKKKGNISLNLMYRKAVLSDLDEIWAFVQNAIEKMISQGIYQWDEIYPCRSDFEADIKNGFASVGVLDGKIASVYVLNKDFDDAYNSADWQYKGNEFCILHRIVVNPDFQNQGVGRFTMIHLMEILLK